MQVHDKHFVPFIEASKVQARVAELGAQISLDYADKSPILLGVLNGAFMFLADLAKHISVPASFSFVKFRSYEATHSTGTVKELIGLNENLKGRHVIVVEDIVDTGLTMKSLLERLEAHEPASVCIAAALLKPEALQTDIEIKYLAFEVPNVFVLGYGMDYNELGRNLDSIYQLQTT